MTLPPMLKDRSFEGASAALLGGVLVFGGSLYAAEIPMLILRLAAIGLAIWSIWRLTAMPLDANRRVALVLLAAIWALPLLQLIPLPPSLWTALPQRADLASELTRLGFELGWRPLSLTPSETRETVLALVIPTALFLAVLHLDQAARYRLILVVLAVAVLSVLVGAFQIASGGSSTLYFYGGTNGGRAVGFFANRNHLATLLAICLPLTVAWMMRGSLKQAMAYPAAGSMVIILLVGLATSGSRAGVVLMFLALVGSAFLFWRDRRRPGGHDRRLFVIIGVVAATLLVLTIAGAWAAFARMNINLETELRFSIWWQSLELALAYLPWGGGAGSYPFLYIMAEQTETLAAERVNRAHNDYVEILVDYGVFGAILLVVVALCVLRAFWRRDPREAREDRLSPLILLGLLLLAVHAIADYPVRMPALTTLTAFMLAIALVPSSETRRREKVRVSRRSRRV